MLDIQGSKSSKPVTVIMNESILKEIEEYGISYSDFIREAVEKHLQDIQKEKLINSYKLAIEKTREESREVNQEMFNASSISRDLLKYWGKAGNFQKLRWAPF